MTSRTLSDVADGITECKAKPMKVATSAHGKAVAVSNRNEPAFYCVSAEAYEALMDKLEGMELLVFTKACVNEEGISVSIANL